VQRNEEQSKKSPGAIFRQSATSKSDHPMRRKGQGKSKKNKEQGRTPSKTFEELEKESIPLQDRESQERSLNTRFHLRKEARARKESGRRESKGAPKCRGGLPDQDQEAVGSRESGEDQRVVG